MTDRYELITSRTNARVKQLRGALAGHSRLSGGLVAIEGEHLLLEAIRSGLALKSVFLADDRDLPETALWLEDRVEIVRLTPEVFRSLSETRTPQGIAALLVPPVHTLENVLSDQALLLVAAGLQDPGNLGTLIRSAEAFGASGVLTTPNTVSAWNQKSLRASMGSLFRLPVVAATGDDLRHLKQHLGLHLLAAVGEDAAIEQPSSLEAHTADLTGPVALLIGNEGAGLAPEWLDLADTLVTISTAPGTVESLNAAVAGSLLLYEAFRQRARAGAARRAAQEVRP